MREGERLGLVHRCAIGRLSNLQLLENCREQFAVFGDFYAFWGGANNIDPTRLEWSGEIERGLAAELHNGAIAFLLLINLEHIFQG